MSIVKKTVKEAVADNITGESAKAAYYFFLSLFPLLIAVFALTGLVGGDAAFRWIMGQLQGAIPGEASTYVEDFVRQITDQQRPGLLSFSILFTVWAASNFFAALGDALDHMFDVDGRASWWEKRKKALLMLVIGALTLVVGAVLILAGPQIFAAIGLGTVGTVLGWILAFVLVATLMGLAYYILPARDQGHLKKQIMIGAVVGTVLWIVVTAGFRFYISNFGNYSETYGVVGGVMVLLIWLYLTALTILFGGEVVDVLEDRAVARGEVEGRVTTDEDGKSGSERRVA